MVSKIPRAYIWAGLIALVGVLLALTPTPMRQTPTARAITCSVLILDTTITGGASSPEATAATSLGCTVTIVTSAQWAAMTQAQFAAFTAIVLGDPTCVGSPAPLAAALANEATGATWRDIVLGNVIVIGDDVTFHIGQPGAQILTKNAIAFAIANTAGTGLVYEQSCYYGSAAPGTPDPLLDNLEAGTLPGTFQVTGTPCGADVHIVATHPALTGLTDANLSGWGCSTHEAFTTFKSTWQALAIAKDVPSTFIAPDGTPGAPYIIVRGTGVIPVGETVALAPATATNPTGTSHTVTATVTKTVPPAPTVPLVGVTVTFTVTAGPNAGQTGTAVTNASGVATFTYTGNTVGTDTIKATFVNSAGTTVSSNEVTKTWTTAPSSVSVTKTATPASVNAGTNATFTITVSNTGAGTAATVTLTDAGLRTGTTVGGADQGMCMPIAGGTLTCSFGPLAGGASRTITVSVPTTAADCAAGVANTATISTTDAGASPRGVHAPAAVDPTTSTATVTVVCPPDVTVTKTAAAPSVAAGTNAVFNITVRNTGSGPAASTTLTDAGLPAGSSVGGTDAAGNCPTLPAAGGTLTCTFGTLNPGDTRTITVTVPTTTANCPTLSNTATVSATGDSTAGGNNTSTASVTVTCGPGPGANRADLTVDKFADPQEPRIGTNFTYTIRVKNNGPDTATGVVLTDTLPAGTTFVSVTPGAPTCTQTGGVVTCTIGSLPNGGEFTANITVTAPLTAGRIVNSAVVTSTSTDPNPRNNTFTYPTQVMGLFADVGMWGSVSGSTRNGGTLTYQIFVKNNGPDKASAVMLTDSFTTGTGTVVSATSSQGTCTTGATVSCTIGDMANGQLVTVTIRATSGATGTLKNTATVSSGGAPGQAVDNQSGNNTLVITSTITR